MHLLNSWSIASWARLIESVQYIDIQRCPNSGAAELKFIARILERPVAEKDLTHLGLEPQATAHVPAREPELHPAGWAASRHQLHAGDGRKGQLGPKSLDGCRHRRSPAEVPAS